MSRFNPGGLQSSFCQPGRKAGPCRRGLDGETASLMHINAYAFKCLSLSTILKPPDFFLVQSRIMQQTQVRALPAALPGLGHPDFVYSFDMPAA